MEHEGQQGALLHDEVDELLGEDLLRVLAGRRQGEAERHAVPLQPVHGRHDLVENAGAATGIGEPPEALDRQAQQRVACLREPPAGGVVDQGAVGEDHVEAVVVPLEQIDDALALGPVGERLAPADDEEALAPQLLGLVHDAVDEAPLERVPAVIGVRVAARAAQVAGLARSHQQEAGGALAERLLELHLLLRTAPVDD